MRGLFKVQKRMVMQRALLNLDTGAPKERLLSQVTMLESAGFNQIGDWIPALHCNAKSEEDVFDDNNSEEQLSCDQNKVVNIVHDLVYIGLYAERAFYLLSSYSK